MSSGLQRSILHLYRTTLRTFRTKPATSRPKFELVARHAFRSADLRARNVVLVENALRRVQRMAEMWGNVNVRDCWVGEEVREWERTSRARARRR